MMETYYNEWDPYAAQWLRNLMAAGHISKGFVDERSIKDIQPGDLPERAHFFAGIAGWEYALELAGWPAECPVWTGSCPCQPFSSAGRRRGYEDERHLWPDFLRLIANRLPPTLFGEQVASADGRVWFSGVRADLEALGYAVGAADLCAAGVGAPHIRQRLFWVARTDHAGWPHIEGRSGSSGKTRWAVADSFGVKGLGNTTGEQIRKCGQPWELSEALECADGWRRIKSGLQPLAYGVPGGMGQKRAYGNAIVPQVAAEFIGAFMDVILNKGGEE